MQFVLLILACITSRFASSLTLTQSVTQPKAGEVLYIPVGMTSSEL